MKQWREANREYKAQINKVHSQTYQSKLVFNKALGLLREGKTLPAATEYALERRGLLEEVYATADKEKAQAQAEAIGIVA